MSCPSANFSKIIRPYIYKKWEKVVKKSDFDPRRQLYFFFDQELVEKVLKRNCWGFEIFENQAIFLAFRCLFKKKIWRETPGDLNKKINQAMFLVFDLFFFKNKFWRWTALDLRFLRTRPRFLCWGETRAIGYDLIYCCFMHQHPTQIYSW